MLPKGPSGNTSTSRSLAWIAFGIVMPLWLGIGAGIAFFGWEWSTWDGYMSWGVEFLFVSMIPTLGREAAEALQKRASVSVTTTEAATVTKMEAGCDDGPC